MMNNNFVDGPQQLHPRQINADPSTSREIFKQKLRPPVSKKTIGGLRENLPKQIFRGPDQPQNMEYPVEMPNSEYNENNFMYAQDQCDKCGFDGNFQSGGYDPALGPTPFNQPCDKCGHSADYFGPNNSRMIAELKNSILQDIYKQMRTPYATFGQPPYDQSSYGQPLYDQPPYDQSSYDQLPYSRQPAYGQPAYGQPPYSRQLAYGQPAYGQPPYSRQPAYSQQPYGQQPYNQPAYGQPPYNQPPYNQPPYGQQSYGQPAYDQPVYSQPAYGPIVYDNPTKYIKTRKRRPNKIRKTDYWRKKSQYVPNPENMQFN